MDRPVDAVVGVFWRCLDRDARVVRKAARPPSFSRRWGPALLALSNEERLLVLGGWQCVSAETSCDPYRGAGRASYALEDVWSSSDFGESWTMLTVSFNPTLSPEVLPGYKAVHTNDDAVWLLQDRTPDIVPGQGCSSAYVSLRPLFDVSLSHRTSLVLPPPPAIIPQQDVQIQLLLKEGVVLAKRNGVRLMYGAENVAVAVTITRQVLTVRTSATLIAGRTCSLSIEAGALQDEAGNGNTQLMGPFTFLVSDNARPFLQDVFPSGSDVLPDTPMRLLMSAPVGRASGDLTLIPQSGGAKRVVLPVALAIVVGRYVYFHLPQDERLVEGMTYAVHVPVRMLMGSTGVRLPNIASQGIFKFTVLSGRVSSAAEAYLKTNQKPTENDQKPTAN